MKFFYPLNHKKHNPSFDYSDGLPPFRHIENKNRLHFIYKSVLKFAKKEDIEHVKTLIDLDYLKQIHDSNYIDFLVNLCDSLDEKEEYIPSMFRKNLQLAPIRFQGGMYCTEIGTPLQKHSMEVILNTAKCSLDGAKHLHKTSQNTFVLARPPGHHAGFKTYAGYCFVNNCIIGADYFLKQKLKPIILDVDYHIGDGTIDLATRMNIEYFSLHINPWKNYPYFSKNVKFAKNIHLEHLKNNTKSKEYLSKFKKTLEKISKINYDVFMLSLGLDTLKNDLSQDGKIFLEKEDFFTMGKLIKQQNKKLIIYLEGGYNMADTSDALEEFLKGLGCKKLN